MTAPAQQSSFGHPVLRVTTPNGASWSISAVHYEIVHVASASAHPLDEPFLDVHVNSTESGGRFVAGYLGVEARGDEHLVVTSHGRDVALVRADERGGVQVSRTEGGSPWTENGIAVLPVEGPGPDEPGARDEAGRSPTAEVYIVHGPAADKVAARTGQLLARAHLLGHPRPDTVDP